MIPVSEAERRDVFLEAIGKKHPLMKLIRRCIDNDSKRRPTANDIVPLLSKEKSPLFTNVQDLLEQIEETRKQLSKAQVRVEELQDELRKAKANPGIGASQKRASHSSGASPHQQHGYGGSQHGGEYRDLALPQGGSAMAAAPRPTISYSFSMGSTIQLHSDPPRYGVIQWIGNLPEIHGQIAGVELEESMDGCGDGLWSGVRYFSCRQGHAFFCPLSSLSPDQRFAQTTTAGGVNPLDYVPFEEEEDQFVDPGQIDLIDKYIGEAKGIQGHQNSCYLDSTVFGLFALSEVFDSLFLDQKAGDPAGDEVKRILWKGIVNPLRKNAVVRYESVMRLRNKLEELGKMKGVNQDEKDPERFLNMLFKHTLHVTPFIRIKRPFGVEHEYFVQLFVEHDKSLQLPTVGDLLKRMFIEQKTRFTKVPSKLLIQIPRYEGGFKTYQKLIPGLKLKVKRLVCSTNRCFICGDTAWNKCHECSNDFLTIDVVYFCENCSDRTHGKTTTRTKHEVTEVTPDPGGINELDLLSVICIETSHYICFTRSEERWVFFDSMASRVDDMYNIPKVVDCTDVLNEWVYPVNGDLTRLLNTPPRELPEYVRRFTQDIYLCVYIQPDFAMYGDVEEDVV